MPLLYARIITVVISVIMVLLFSSPIGITYFYFLFRPLVQPFSINKYTIFANIPLTSVFSIIIIAAAYLNGLFRSDATLRHGRIVPLYLMLYFSLMSLFYTPSYSDSIGQILKMLGAIGIYILIFNALKTDEDARKILWAYVLGSIAPMLFGYYQYVTGTGHAWGGEYYIGKRIDSFLGIWNEYGMFLSITIVAATMLLLQESSRIRRLFIIGIIGSLLLSSILALNRGSWVSLSMGFIVASFFYRDKIKIKWLVFASLIIVLAFGGVIYERFSALHQLSSAGRTQDTFMGRIAAWMELLPIALEKPFFGHGIGAIVKVTQKYFNTALIPHNDYIRLCVEIGFIGVSIYIFFLVSELFRCVRNVRRNENWKINYPMFVAMVYFVIISSVQNILQSATVLPMFLGLLAISHKYDKLLVEKEPQIMRGRSYGRKNVA